MYHYQLHCLPKKPSGRRQSYANTFVHDKQPTHSQAKWQTTQKAHERPTPTRPKHPPAPRGGCCHLASEQVTGGPAAKRLPRT